MLNEDALKQVMATMLNVDAATINEDSSMDNVPSWDSLRHMNLVLALEEEFKVTIPDEDAGNITSYKLIKLVLNDLGV
ncbi:MULTISPECIES: acyl carrier protein [unclassified Duganella]|jgi:acyl carrier protein|uniref:acyl carrier protein n=1 Tax=unclassified Duganella TaxID=2636909 RepID=UPI00088DE211|nr:MULTISPECIES: phosphopantetheine-binding protein [unclassified Duganella]SDH50303.1 acyl carrier protein [Duganella sp. OV458]SDK63154.1 acyl carrier protein [Duganella sp. OV510]